jgi:hypothetical protein
MMKSSEEWPKCSKMWLTEGGFGGGILAVEPLDEVGEAERQIASAIERQLGVVLDGASVGNVPRQP